MPSLKSIDSALETGHKRIAEKLNDLFGWSNYQVAKGVNISARMGSLVGLEAVNYFKFNQDGDVLSLAYTSMASAALLGLMTYHRHWDIGQAEQQHKYTGETMIELDSRLNVGRHPLFHTFLLGSTIVSGVKMELNGKTSPNDLIPEHILNKNQATAFTVAGSIGLISDISVDYLLRNSIKPGKGKFQESLESLVARAKSALSSPLPSPQANYLPSALELYAAAL